LTTKIRPIKAEDISPADFDRNLKMLRWLARNHPEKTRHVFLTIKAYYSGLGGPRLREGGAS
jgi:hypothetical protein